MGTPPSATTSTREELQRMKNEMNEGINKGIINFSTTGQRVKKKEYDNQLRIRELEEENKNLFNRLNDRESQIKELNAKFKNIKL